MRNFKRTAFSVLCFLVVVALISVACIGFYYHTEWQHFMDGRVRRSLSGSLDFLIIGSSLAWNGFAPQVLDEELGVNSYNLSSGVMPMHAKTLMVEKELKRNPVKTVLIEIAYDTLTRDTAQDYSEGDEMVIARMDSWGERFEYMRTYLSINDVMNVYSRALLRGVQAWLTLFRGEEGVVPARKGYYPRVSNDQTIAPEDVAAAYHKKTFSLADYRQVNVDELVDLIETCRAYGAEPILVTFPISDRANWTIDHLVDYGVWMEEFCREHGCAFYNCNLLRDRYDLFSDSVSFFDPEHLSDAGAQAFTRRFSELLGEVWAGESIADAFYSDSDAMLQDSPYMEFLTAR